MTARSNNINACFTKLYWLENNMRNNFLNAIFANTHTLSIYTFKYIYNASIYLHLKQNVEESLNSLI